MSKKALLARSAAHMNGVSKVTNHELTKTIAKNIKRFREEKGWSQETLGRMFNKASTTVSTWERGSSMPDAVTMYRLAEVFNRNVEDLYK